MIGTLILELLDGNASDEVTEARQLLRSGGSDPGNHVPLEPSRRDQMNHLVTSSRACASPRRRPPQTPRVRSDVA
jgi:hypothetical protein